MKLSKRRAAIKKLAEPNKVYGIKEAVEIVKKGATAKFDETIELSVKLGVDPKQSDQQVRGTVVMPHGTGKKQKILVFAKGEKEKEATAAGADIVGAEDLIEKVSKGWTDFDVAVATPDMMKDVGKLGKVLGPRGLMPNPKTGTVTFDLAKAVREIKAGKVEYKVNAEGVLHTIVGKASFEPAKLEQNLTAIMDAIMKAKPATSKGVYLRGVAIASTMGIGVRLDTAQFGAATVAAA
jgi:large subunit ribosomal protein L1